MIPLIKPYIDELIKSRVLTVLESGFLTEGHVTKSFEEKFCEFAGCQYAIAVTSCTTGLELALRATGIKPGDEVIVPDYTYPATADAACLVGAHIVVVDIDPHTMLIDYDKIEASITPKTKVIIPVSLFGNPLDYDRLNEIKKKYGIILIEDAACAIGAEYRTKKTGNLADMTVFSFHPRKFITTGEGGMITTNQKNWADWMRSFKKHGIVYDESGKVAGFDFIGSNYKLSDILAAVGLAQMEHFDKLFINRRQLADNYISLINNSRNIIIPQTTPNGLHSYQSFCVFVNDARRLIVPMAKAGIQVQIGTYALHRQKAFSNNSNCRFFGEMTESEMAFQTCLALPLYNDLTIQEQKLVVENLITLL